MPSIIPPVPLIPVPPAVDALKAREYAIADMARAAKTLATVPARHPLIGGAR